MPMIRVENFGGMVPLQDEHLLQSYHASYAQNCYVQSGTLSCITALVPVHNTVQPGTRSVYRVPKANAGIDNMVDSYWMEFPNENTWVARNPTPGLTDGGRFYWADGDNPPLMTTKDRLAAGFGALKVGIPSPGVAPGVSVSGGTTPTETRGYVYTWVSASGEEGPPSPPTVLAGNANGTWHITMTAPTVDDTTNRTLTTTRIYRTVTNQQGVADFFFVDEMPIATLVYDDILASGVVALHDTLKSENWLPPPDDINGLVNMPNGMIAGFRKNEVWFCEPYLPHAWPPQYVLGVESEIVGLGVQQQSLIILTVGWTYIATGIRPDAMTLTKVSNLQPCTSMGSIVSSPEGVMYTSVNGLIVCANGVEINATANLVRKDQWPKLIYLPNAHATYQNRSYIAFSSPGANVFQEDAFQEDAFQGRDFTGTQNGVYLTLTDERTALMPLYSDLPVDNVITDVWTGEFFLLRNGVVEHVDIRKDYPRLGYVWRSKNFQTPYKENWAAAKVFFQQPPGPPPDRPTIFRLYADGKVVHQRVLDVSGKQFRLPSGFKCDFMQFEIDGQLVIYNVQIATSARELRNA